MKYIIFLMILFSANSIYAELDYPSREVRIELLTKIIAQAEKEWPNNYFMQRASINSEVEALKEISQMKEILKKK